MARGRQRLTSTPARTARRPPARSLRACGRTICARCGRRDISATQLLVPVPSRRCRACPTDMATISEIDAEIVEVKRAYEDALDRTMRPGQPLDMQMDRLA